ncbi:uncharacterized protein Z518_06748 [Rhinocladiella mackenziei CBS 650.93]|uniref:Transcription factor domain-containing protein n=1 Tax=Rhinocladiella mackenziei CBS 650.93 TaxID=1442369 RepID=A0A0D2IIS6_9EURO|nr:uncharacterized protein Z518_06748 [Rhinocladiella mackenziei CBS 650.93]KIX03196.1 hypothetical protein Z518_06748 [Rhinocladiella mackenziei CBS 650.93]
MEDLVSRNTQTEHCVWTGSPLIEPVPDFNNFISQNTVNECGTDISANDPDSTYPSFSLWPGNSSTSYHDVLTFPEPHDAASRYLFSDGFASSIQPQPSFESEYRERRGAHQVCQVLLEEFAGLDWARSTLPTNAPETESRPGQTLSAPAWCAGLSVPVDWALVAESTQNAQQTLNDTTGLEYHPCFKTDPLPWMSSKQTLFAEVARFFTESFERYPVIHLDTVLRKLDDEVHLKDVEFRTLVLSIIMMNRARQFRAEHLNSGLEREQLKSLASTIEMIRRTNEMNYDFSEKPSLDTVVVSSFLFMAYIALRQHNRAFTYLTEAIGLLDMIETLPDSVEVARMLRLEHILFVTESATIFIFGWRRRRLARYPSTLGRQGHEAMKLTLSPSLPLSRMHSWNGFFPVDFAELDRRALKLLLSMTRLFTASGLAEAEIIYDDDGNLIRATTSCGGDAIDDVNVSTSGCDGYGCISTQSADVILTQQWRLAFHWHKAIQRGYQPQCFAGLDEKIQKLSSATIRLSRAVSPQQFRIIGLGKILALTDSIVSITMAVGASITTRVGVVGELMRLVADADYERNFSAQLSSLELYVRNIPRSLHQDPF